MHRLIFVFVSLATLAACSTAPCPQAVDSIQWTAQGGTGTAGLLTVVLDDGRVCRWSASERPSLETERELACLCEQGAADVQ